MPTSHSKPRFTIKKPSGSLSRSTTSSSRTRHRFFVLRPGPRPPWPRNSIGPRRPRIPQHLLGIPTHFQLPTTPTSPFDPSSATTTAPPPLADLAPPHGHTADPLRPDYLTPLPIAGRYEHQSANEIHDQLLLFFRQAVEEPPEDCKRYTRSTAVCFFCRKVFPGMKVKPDAGVMGRKLCESCLFG
jgi:hypothetical protein